MVPSADDLLTALTGVDSAPPPQLDPYLDAASRCFARYGISRTSVRDVAAELGVDRTTVYRQIGNVPQMIRLLAARDLRHLVTSVKARLPLPLTAAGVVGALAVVVQEVRSHPVIARVLSDEPGTVSLGGLVDVAELLALSVSVLGPALHSAMESGRLASTDPSATADWLIRLAATLVLVPPPIGVEEFLSAIVLPVLEAPAAS